MHGALYVLAAIALLLAFLWQASSVARYYLKLSIYATVAVVFATLPIPLMLLKPGSSTNALYPAYWLRKSCWCLGLKTRVTGQENIVKRGGSVVLINHQSVIDLIVLAELWGVMNRCTVISKKEIFYIWPFGLAAWLWGTIFIDRLNAAGAQEQVNRTGELIRRREARVLMFPEGTRSRRDTLLPFKKGAFHLAIASGCPVQPVVVRGYDFLGPQRFENGTIDIHILPAIETTGFTRETITDLIDRTHAAMSAKFVEMNGTGARPRAENGDGVGARKSNGTNGTTSPNNNTIVNGAAAAASK